jgi:hypothetical protein
LKKSSQEVRKEFLIAYNENQRLQKLVHDFKNNDEVFLNIQTIAEEKVKALFGKNNAMKLLEFALIAVSEVLRQDPQMELLIEKTPIQITTLILPQ